MCLTCELYFQEDCVQKQSKNNSLNIVKQVKQQQLMQITFLHGLISEITLAHVMVWIPRKTRELLRNSLVKHTHTLLRELIIEIYFIRSLGQHYYNITSNNILPIKYNF